MIRRMLLGVVSFAVELNWAPATNAGYGADAVGQLKRLPLALSKPRP
jgi:hypothetical protein